MVKRMNYKEAEKLKPAEFKRLYGVDQETFQEMVKVVAAEKVLQKKTGRPSKLTVEDQVLMTLTYWREYRTYFHIGKNQGVNETTALRITPLSSNGFCCLTSRSALKFNKLVLNASTEQIIFLGFQV